MEEIVSTRVSYCACVLDFILDLPSWIYLHNVGGVLLVRSMKKKLHFNTSKLCVSCLSEDWPTVPGGS